jgi:hypothetical protein
MTFTLLDFIAVIFATGAVIEVWHKGSIFDHLRAYSQAVQDVTAPDSIKGKLLELLNCPFCKSYHVPFYFFIALLAGVWLGDTMAAAARLIIYSLAATRVSNIVDGLLPARMRYVQDPFGDNHGQSADTRSE